jgi:hypothetical protein
MANALGELTLKNMLAMGHYPVNPIQLDPVAERILHDAKQNFQKHAPFDDIGAELSERLSGAAVQAMAINLLHPGKPTRCPQYEVFQLSTNSATILNFNNDGLADAFCSKHVVLNMHGTSIDPQQRNALGWNQWIESLQMYPSIKALHIPGLLLPQPEPQRIIESLPFRIASRHIVQAKRVALIGYSFGAMDDAVSYRMLTKTVACTRAPIVIVGPDVNELVARLREDVQSANVKGLSAYWNVLAESIIVTATRRFHKSCSLQRRCSRCIAYAYCAIQDADKH